MYEITSFDCSRIAQDLQIRKVQVEAVVQLFDEGNTVPFITRYRKERTGGLNEDVIRQIQTRVVFLRQLADRKQTILKSLETQGKLTDDLRKAIASADTTKRLEDLYLPYKPKKKSLASAARDRGLEPLALAVWNRDPALGNLEELLPSLVNPDNGLSTVEDVRAGMQYILAEMIAETADVRAEVRTALWETGKVRAGKSDKLADGQGLEYKDYFEFTEPTRQIPAHRILALNRGEKEGALKVHLEFPMDIIQDVALKALSGHLLTSPPRTPTPPRKPKVESAPSAQAVTPAAEGRAEAPLPTETVVESAPPAAVEAAQIVSEPGPTASGEAAGEAPQIEPETSATAEAVSTPAPVAEETPPVAESASIVTEPPPPAPEAPSLDIGQATPLPLPEVTGESLAGGEYCTPHAVLLRKVLDDALARLLLPSLEREIRHELTDEAENHAVAVFARNLRSLLLQPPLHGRRILAVDPGLRTGCKVAVLDEYGTLLENTVIYPFGSPGRKERREKSKAAPVEPKIAEAPAESPPAPTATEQTVAAVTEAAAPVADAPAPVADVAAPAVPTVEEPSAQVEVAQTLAVEATPAEAAVAPVSGIVAWQIPTPAVADAAFPVADIAPPPADAPPVGDGTPPLVDAAGSHGPDRKGEARAKLRDLLVKHQVQIVALGNGTGCRETEEIIADLIAADLPDLAYVIVNEAGASVYSVSAYGREEFPNFDATLRSTISIGRRLQDPLSELVKVDPPNIGVGLYQHDINRKDLRESLDAVVESCVNQVGVDLNTASVPLLRHVSGLNQLVARELVEHRQKNGPFTSREQLLQVSGMGPVRFVQAAGFLKIPGGANPLDRTWIHPESYVIAEKILTELGYTARALDDKPALEELQTKLKALPVEDLARNLEAGAPTVYDILQSLARPGRDPREDLPPPIFKKGILKLEDLQAGMELKGTVLNVVDFGAFVDIGLKDSGLVHISQMANRYIKSPYDVVAVSDVVKVWVLNVDKDRHRVSLTMIQPGTERKPQERERRPMPPRDQQRSRPPRERRPVGAGAPQGQGQGPQQQGPGQGQGPRQDDRRRPPPRGRQGPPRRGPAPVGSGPPGTGQQPPGEGQVGQNESVKTPPPPPPPPRKPRREAPKPKLSQDALEGKVPLRTFGELSVLFHTKKEKKPEPQREPPPPPPAAEPPVVVEAVAPPENNKSAEQVVAE